MREQEVIFSIVVGGFVVAVLFVLLLLFLLYYVRNKNRYIREREELRSKYQIELARVELEIQEETLRQVGLELHDNIGQLVTLAKIQTQSLAKVVSDTRLPALQEVISKALEEVRRLSKSLNQENLARSTLAELIGKDCERVNQLEVVRMNLLERGTPTDPGQQRKIILYRIVQELVTNALKHAQCSQIDVEIEYFKDALAVSVGDDGIGFDAATASDSPKAGVGLLHIRGRLQLINGTIELSSGRQKGAAFYMRCPMNQ